MTNRYKVRIILFWWSFDASNPCLFVGGSYNRSLYLGLFYVYYSAASNSYAFIGSRLQKLP